MHNKFCDTIYYKGHGPGRVLVFSCEPGAGLHLIEGIKVSGKHEAVQENILDGEQVVLAQWLSVLASEPGVGLHLIEGIRVSGKHEAVQENRLHGEQGVLSQG